MNEPLWDELADLALTHVCKAGVEYADIRLLDSTTRAISGEDRRIAHIREASDRGFGIRVLHRGAWGFAASSILSQEEIPRVADLAVEIAKGSASLAIEKVHLAPEPIHRDHIETPCRVDPFAVPLEEQTALLLTTMETIQRQSGVVRSHAGLWAQRDRKLFVSTEGSHLTFTLLAMQGDCTATSVHDGRFATRSFSTPHLRMGYELIRDADF
ncbi:MAG TPA: DNA gyrase modulator, partial [Nitrospira sp.]|nr:DNA gyrase modulator [Nitrospira sp.]